MNKEKMFGVISTGAGLLIAIIGAFMSNSEIVKSYGYMWGVYSIIFTSLAWLVSAYRLMIMPAIKERKNILWKIEKEKEPEKIKLSVDVHKSSNWENDSQIFLCIHNESFFRDIKNISIGIAAIRKKVNGGSEFELNRSVILHEKVNIPKMRAAVDFSFLEVVKKDNKFVIRAIHQESPNKEIFEHEFGHGEYLIDIWLKRNDIARDISIPVPIVVKYDGWDKISGKVDEIYSKAMLPIAL